MPAGQPTKYNEDTQAFADKYVNDGYIDCGDAVPSVAGLASELGVKRQTLYNWAERHEQFFDTLDRLSSKQERTALSKGLTNDFNSTIVKLILANHGYSERSNIDHTTKGEALTMPKFVMNEKTNSEKPD